MGSARLPPACPGRPHQIVARMACNDRGTNHPRCGRCGWRPAMVWESEEPEAIQPSHTFRKGDFAAGVHVLFLPWRQRVHLLVSAGNACGDAARAWALAIAHKRQPGRTALVISCLLRVFMIAVRHCTTAVLQLLSGFRSPISLRTGWNAFPPTRRRRSSGLSRKGQESCLPRRIKNLPRIGALVCMLCANHTNTARRPKATAVRAT